MPISRRSLRLADMALQTLHQSLESDPAAWTVAQVLVHGDPGFQRKRDLLRENAHDRLVATGDCRLANADSGARSHQRQLSEVAVRANNADGSRLTLAQMRTRSVSAIPIAKQETAQDFKWGVTESKERLQLLVL